MGEPDYPTADEVISLQNVIVGLTGTRPALLRGGGRGLLESALNTGKQLAYYEQADVIAQAARVAIAISQNQPFEDGNKRSAFLVTDILLRINVWRRPDPINGLEFEKRLEAVAEVR